VEKQTIVGVFGGQEVAQSAVKRASEAGFDDDDIGIVSGNVRQAREPAGSFSPRGAAIGVVVALVVFGAFALGLGEPIRENAVAVPLGLVGFLVAGAAIGALAGRARGLKAGEYSKLENAVERGNALVTIRCETSARSRAASLLRDAGARSVRVEETGEAV
jgi:hypothetical protein